MLVVAQDEPGDQSWRLQAACRGVHPDAFFPAGATGLPAEQAERACSVCRACPVAVPCLRYAVETNQQYGVWGGRTEAERRILRRQWRATRRWVGVG